MSKFTLMKDGEAVLSNTTADKVIKFLKDIDKVDLPSALIAALQPFFDKYPEVDKFYLANWGSYYKYEMAGKSYFHEAEDENCDIPEDAWEDYCENFCTPVDKLITKTNVLATYGATERGGSQLYAERGEDGKVKILVGDYDPE